MPDEAPTVMGAGDETSRRAVLLFALPVSRTRLASTDIAVATAGTVLLLTTAGLAMWTGAGVAGAPLGVGDALAGALNVAPVAVLCIGAAVLALGWAPRAVLVVGALPAAGGFLLHVLARSSGAPEWVSLLSPFAHLAGVPQTSPDWAGAAGMCAVAAVLGGLAVLGGYTRRDLTG